MSSHTTSQTRESSADEQKRAVDDQRGCSECGSAALVRSDDGREVVCEDCGLVHAERDIDRGPEWRAFTDRERRDKSRTGSPLTPRQHDRGLTTSIDWKDRDAHGRSIAPRKRKRMRRLRTWQERIRTDAPGEKNLKYALAEIDRMASALGIPESTREIAAVIYRNALKENLVLGRSIEGVATSALYAACRMDGLPRCLGEVAVVSRIDRREVARTYTSVSDELNLAIGPTDPREYIPRFASKLDLEEPIRREARQLIERAGDHELISGRSPTGLAGAALYTAMLLHDTTRSQQSIAEVARVSVVTLRSRHRELVDEFDLAL